MAGEYVLGVLDHDTAREVEAARATNPALSRAISFWESQLHPLTALVPPAEPPACGWQRHRRTPVAGEIRVAKFARLVAFGCARGRCRGSGAPGLHRARSANGWAKPRGVSSRSIRPDPRLAGDRGTRRPDTAAVGNRSGPVRSRPPAMDHSGKRGAARAARRDLRVRPPCRPRAPCGRNGRRHACHQRGAEGRLADGSADRSGCLRWHDHQGLVVTLSHAASR